MRIGLEPRIERSAAVALLAPVVAVLLTLLAGAILFALLGHAPGAALYAFFISPIDSRYGLGELGVKAAPLVLIALGLAFGFRAGVWNIGAEGQFTLGAICGGGIALFLPDVGAPWLFPLMLLAGVLGGMLWAAIPALLKARFEVNEILTSLMLSYVALLLLSTLVHGPWKDPEGFGFPQSRLFPEAATAPLVLAGTRLHLGALVALLAVPVAWVVERRALGAFGARVAGLAPAAARYAGFRRPRVIWAAMLISGGLAGLAGVFEVAGPIGQLVPRISPGYGFTAIIVAFLGRLHPAGVLLAGLVVALSYIGAENAQIEAGLPQAVGGVFQGMLLFFLLGCEVFARYRLRAYPARRRA